MHITCDAQGYQILGNMLNTHGWTAYFESGPNREPLYPFLVSVSMALENITGLAYVKIMAVFGVMIMLLTQVLTYKILRLLHIRHGVCILVLVYVALSPALTNTAFSLFSEIATYPFILGIILTSFFTWENIRNDKKYWAIFYCLLLGVMLTMSTLIKGIFECIAPVYLMVLFSAIYLTDKKTITKRMSSLILCLIASLSLFYGPVSAYKWLNFHYNGNFALTGRASWMIYGNTARRAMPLTPKKFAEAMAYVPGEGVCNKIFGAQECSYWSFQVSDGLGMAEQDELNSMHVPRKEGNTALIRLAVQKAIHNPFQYLLLAMLESLKMFFWESTKIGFVTYPPWLQKIYDVRIFDNILRFSLFLLTWLGVMHLWFGRMSPQKSPIGFLLGVLIFIYIFFFSFVSILTRYALPIAPLYLIAIGIWINQKLPSKKIT